ncbi:hypothetical protein Tco_0797772 [Tanacetum coccineum]
MYNNIMAAGSRDRPPMLATGRYAQWRSRFLRYIDTRPNGDILPKCILKGPYTPMIVTTPVVPATEDSPAVPEQTTVETVMNMTPENRAHFELEKEAIHLILTGIGDVNYTSMLMHVKTAQENVGCHRKGTTSESTQYSSVKTNLFWEFGQFHSHDGDNRERISKKRTKNEAKMTKPDTEWKSVEKTKESEDGVGEGRWKVRAQATSPAVVKEPGDADKYRASVPAGGEARDSDAGRRCRLWR